MSLAYTITAILEAALLLYMFLKNFPKLKIKEIYSSLYKILIASVIMFVITFTVRQLLGSVISLQTFWGIFLQLVLSGVVAVAVYAFTAYFLKSEELKIIMGSLMNKFLYAGKD